MERLQDRDILKNQSFFLQRFTPDFAVFLKKFNFIFLCSPKGTPLIVNWILLTFLLPFQTATSSCGLRVRATSPHRHWPLHVGFPTRGFSMKPKCFLSGFLCHWFYSYEHLPQFLHQKHQKLRCRSWFFGSELFLFIRVSGFIVCCVTEGGQGLQFFFLFSNPSIFSVVFLFCSFVKSMLASGLHYCHKHGIAHRCAFRRSPSFWKWRGSKWKWEAAWNEAPETLPCCPSSNGGRGQLCPETPFIWIVGASAAFCYFWGDFWFDYYVFYVIVLFCCFCCIFTIDYHYDYKYISVIGDQGQRNPHSTSKIARIFSVEVQTACTCVVWVSIISWEISPTMPYHYWAINFAIVQVGNIFFFWYTISLPQIFHFFNSSTHLKYEGWLISGGRSCVQPLGPQLQPLLIF